MRSHWVSVMLCHIVFLMAWEHKIAYMSHCWALEENYWYAQIDPKRMKWCFRPRFCTVRLNWARDKRLMINFVMNHAAGAGLIARPVDQQYNVLPELLMPTWSWRKFLRSFNKPLISTILCWHTTPLYCFNQHHVRFIQTIHKLVTRVFFFKNLA